MKQEFEDVVGETSRLDQNGAAGQSRPERPWKDGTPDCRQASAGSSGRAARAARERWIKLPTRDEFELVSALLSVCRVDAAYNLGIASALVWEADLEIDAPLLARAAACSTVPHAIRATKQWIEERRRERAR